MSEYDFVEKPFLDQLAALGWQVIDQGPAFPTDPAKSFRKSFREVVLRDIFQQSVRAINLTEDGCPWLIDKQLEELYEQITIQPGNSLLEANENALKLLYRTQVDVNELTGEQYPNVKLIDFRRPERNHFLAIEPIPYRYAGRCEGLHHSRHRDACKRPAAGGYRVQGRQPSASQSDVRGVPPVDALHRPA